MKVDNLDDILELLRGNKGYYQQKFGVLKMGILGSFAIGAQNSFSDVDILVELDKDSKKLHNFLALKRSLEEDLGRKVDLGFLHTLKPEVDRAIKGNINYV